MADLEIKKEFKFSVPRDTLSLGELLALVEQIKNAGVPMDAEIGFSAGSDQRDGQWLRITGRWT